MLSKAESSIILWVFGMTRHRIEPRSTGPLTNTLPNSPKSIYLLVFFSLCICLFISVFWLSICYPSQSGFTLFLSQFNLSIYLSLYLSIPISLCSTHQISKSFNTLSFFLSFFLSFSDRFGLVLWHINYSRLLMPNPFNTYKQFYFKLLGFNIRNV